MKRSFKKLKTALLSFTILIVAAHTLQAQGINFEQTLNWQQIKAKAKAENKYIFVDCYATWCGPCKEMDKNVYPLDSIGQFANKSYVSVKIQFDKTKNDNSHVKSWYAVANTFSKNYQITAYPTYLFFSPNGVLVHRAIGYEDPGRFMGILKRTLKPDSQYYTLLKKYNSNTLPLDKYLYLTGLAKSIEDDATAKKIGVDYINNHLDYNNNKFSFKPLDISVIQLFISDSKSKGFRFFYDNIKKIDSVMNNDGFAEKVVYQMIENEEINPRFATDQLILKDNSKTPDWSEIYRVIQNKYDQNCADFMLICGKIKWAQKEKNWVQYCKNLIDRVEKYGPFNPNPNSFYGGGTRSSRLNGAAYNIFLASSDRGQLNQALKWSEETLNDEVIDPLHYSYYQDTYANLLYKSGRKNEAVAMENKAITDLSNSLIGASANKTVMGQSAIQQYKLSVEKMNNGQPTWPNYN